MRKYYFTITSILVFGLTSCSNEESKTQHQTASRPTVPVMAGEVQIGNQIWMTKNLNVSRYRNGDPIPQVTNATQWANLTTGAWCYYSNNTANGPIYGKLYNWYAVNDPRGMAPEGWHIPTDAEWTVLIDFLGGEDVAGGKMKSIGTSFWISPNRAATNNSGFTALPGGHRNADLNATFNTFGAWCSLWSSTEQNQSGAWITYMDFNFAFARKDNPSKVMGHSVRCVRN